MILSHQAAFDLLDLQMVNRTCRDIVKDSKSFQAKLFMEQDALTSKAVKSGASEFRWNPFLMKYGVPLRSKLGTHEHRIKIKSEDLQYLDHPKFSCQMVVTSWRMFVAYPTTLDFRVFVKAPSGVELLQIHSKRKEGVRMNFLKHVDRERFDTIFIVAGY